MNAAMYTPGPVAAVLEETAGTWLKELLAIPSESAFAFVTGAQMANTTCLAAARNAVLAQFGWDVESKGLIGAPDLHVLCPETRHGAVDRALRLLGIGSQRMTAVPCDRAGRVLEPAFRAALEKCGKVPIIVTLQAGDINTGEFDDFVRLIPISKQHSAWVHIDGAFGLWAAVSSKYRHFLKGADAADSWCVDGHKWLNVPYDCGYSFVRNAQALHNAMGMHASYLVHSTTARDQIDWNPELSRRARGIPTYAAIRQLGRQGIVDLIERCCAHASAIVERLSQLPRVEVLHWPVLNQGVVRFHHPNSTDESTHDTYTDRIIDAVAKSGEAYFSGTNFHGRRAMRISVSNWRTSDSDVDRAITAFAKALNTIR